MSDLGSTLRQAREAAGLSLAGMAQRTGFSRSHIANVEKGVRAATPAVIRAYERALGEDVNRRDLLLGAMSTVVAGGMPDVAVDVVRDISAQRSRLLSTAQTSHQTDRVIGSLIAKDTPCVGSLMKWMRKGSPVLRVNSAGILAKIGSPVMDDEVIRALRRDSESQRLYLQAVVSRVLGMPWDDARGILIDGIKEPSHVSSFAGEIRNPYDSAARWCSVVMLARIRHEDRPTVDNALGLALRGETSLENLRTIAGTLAGLDPLTV